MRLLEDLYTAAFFVPKDAQHEHLIPTNQTLIAAHQGQIDPKVAEFVRGIARRQRFLHWRLAFPQVFEREQAGFDVVLGNPPWDVSQLSEEEFLPPAHQRWPLWRAPSERLLLLLSSNSAQSYGSNIWMSNIRLRRATHLLEALAVSP